MPKSLLITVMSNTTANKLNISMSIERTPITKKNHNDCYVPSFTV